ncbi:hypothetical protein HanRHA438_Chr10g0441391 [Helianthus annuus]|nr:hypothetical protein HanRHA438_Chr10g0441391 [Helianthus annuus]
MSFGNIHYVSFYYLFFHDINLCFVNPVEVISCMKTRFNVGTNSWLGSKDGFDHQGQCWSNLECGYCLEAYICQNQLECFIKANMDIYRMRWKLFLRYLD